MGKLDIHEYTIDVNNDNYNDLPNNDNISSKVLSHLFKKTFWAV